VFTKVAKRSVVNLSETHRKILGALYDLQQEFPSREGLSQREIKAGASVSQSVVSENKTFLVTSAKLLKETESGLALVEGAEPSWWDSGDLTKGLPSPAKVRAWWDEQDPPPRGGGGESAKGAGHADHADRATNQSQNSHTYAGNADRLLTDQPPITNPQGGGDAEGGGPSADHDREVIGTLPISENGIGKPKTGDDDSLIGMIGKISGSEGENGKCPHGTPHGYPCDDCEIDTLFGAGVLADNCASCSSAEAGHGEQGELCEECAVAEGAL
jgi:hypothetical protein